MNETPFHALVAIAKADQQLIFQQKKLEQLRHDETLLHEQEEAAAQRLDVARKQVHDLRKKIDLDELEKKSLRDQEIRKRRQLESVVAPKEYFSLQQEIDRVLQSIETVEDTILETFQQLELAEADLATLEATVSEQLTQYQKERQQVAQERLQLEQSLTDLETERVQKFEKIPVEWRESYDQMKEYVENPVVEVQQDSCSGCFYTVTTPVMVQLRRNTFVPCVSCYRWLYLS